MGYEESGLVTIAKREHNTKRGYLIVNPLQGKHIAVSPKRALKLFSDLADTLRRAYAGERLLLVGFAETATAIGAQAAVSLGADYIQTTREDISGADYLFFSEEHSHAVQQRLVRQDMDAAVSGGAARVVFVEDELTTGKTILNLVSILEARYPGKLKFSAASLLNGMMEENRNRFGQRGIDLHYLVKTEHGGYDRRARAFAGDGNYYPRSEQEAGDVPQLRITGRMDARRLVHSPDYEAACKRLWEEIYQSVGQITGKRVLVVGTEEFMYPALYAGARLEERGNAVFCHSTTRSPIAVSMEAEYPLHERYELASLYDEKRRTFLYDIGSYDAVLVVTDAPEHVRSGQDTLINALRTRNENVTLIRWC